MPGLDRRAIAGDDARNRSSRKVAKTRRKNGRDGIPLPSVIFMESVPEKWRNRALSECRSYKCKSRHPISHGESFQFQVNSPENAGDHKSPSLANIVEYSI
jgi:hypothetical protein